MMISIDKTREQLQCDPFNCELRLRLVQLLKEAGNLHGASQELQILLRQFPHDARYSALEAEIAQLATSPEVSVVSEPVAAIKTVAHMKLATPHSGEGLQRENVVSIHQTESVRFADIAGMHAVKKTIKRKIIEPFINPGIFAKFKKKSGGGVLLYGPPGCGKTLIAKAIAKECKASFFAVGISDILGMYIGQSESQLASIFDRARQAKPAVLFFDELDALAYSRSKAHSDHTRTLVNEFLHQLDGAQTNNEQLLILGATNMPWDVDDAMKRPGRFDRQLFVPPLDADAKAEILQRKLVGVPCGPLDYSAIVNHCRFFSGADMDGLIDEAKDYALDDIAAGNTERILLQKDFLLAAQQIMPTTLDWLKTASNLVKYGNAGGNYRDVADYLREHQL